MLSTFLGDLDDVVQQMLVDERVELISFTGSVQVGRLIAARAGYKKLCLELGGNSPSDYPGRRRPGTGRETGRRRLVPKFRSALHGRQANPG